MSSEDHTELDAAADGVLTALNEAYPEGLPQWCRTSATRLQDALDAGGVEADLKEMWEASDALLAALARGEGAWTERESCRWLATASSAAYGAAHATGPGA